MLELKNILFEYSRESRFLLEIGYTRFTKGRITGVLGKNGSGKTTLLKILGGHLKPSHGNIVLNGADVYCSVNNYHFASTVFQNIVLFPHLNVRDNIYLGIDPNGIWGVKKEHEEKLLNIISDYDLTAIQNNRPHELSIGQQQKVAIARAVATKPKVLLFDEPTSALDFSNVRMLINTLKELKERELQAFIILVSHDLNFLEAVSDDFKYIENGTIKFEGSRQDFLNIKSHLL